MTLCAKQMDNQLFSESINQHLLYYLGIYIGIHLGICVYIAGIFYAYFIVILAVMFVLKIKNQC